MKIFLILFLAGCAAQSRNDAGISDLSGASDQSDMLFHGIIGGIPKVGHEDNDSRPGSAIHLDRYDAETPAPSTFDGSMFRACQSEIAPIIIGDETCLEQICIGDCTICINGIIFCFPNVGDPPPPPFS